MSVHATSPASRAIWRALHFPPKGFVSTGYITVDVPTYGNLKVNHLLCKRRELVVEAEAVLSKVVGGEDVVSLTLLGTLHHGSFVGSDHRVVNIKGSARLNLEVSDCHVGRCMCQGTHGEVEGDLGATGLHICKEARFLVRLELICQCCGGDERRNGQGQEWKEEHRDCRTRCWQWG